MSQTKFEELKNTIRELIQDDIDLDEASVTGALDGGAGPPKTPFAFNGKRKKDILDKAMYGDVTEDIPASILQRHNNVEVFYCD